MRVLCTTLGSPSHGRAQLPLLRALAASGHEILAATTPELSSLFQPDGIPVNGCLPDFSPSAFAGPALAELTENSEQEPEALQAAMLRIMADAVSGPLARQLREELQPLVRDFQPDLILRDGMDLGSCLLGEKYGIPQLPTPSGASNTLDPTATLPGLNTLREELGLPVQQDPATIAPHGRIDCVPAEFSYAQHLAGAWAYRQSLQVDRSSVLPSWVAQLPPERPLVFAAIGTALPMMRKRQQDGQQMPDLPVQPPEPTETLDAIIAAAALLTECTVIVATAGMPVPDRDLPDHVHLTEHLPQPLLLECCDLFLTHGGFNSMREAQRTATPMAVLPQFGDQHANAQRSTELNLGRAVTDSTPEGIVASCREVLHDDGIRATARRARLAMLALPEIDSAVPDLEKLVSRHSGVRLPAPEDAPAADAATSAASR